MFASHSSCWSYTRLLISNYLFIGLLIIFVTIEVGHSNLDVADSSLMASSSGWGQPPNSPPTCHCAPRPVKYVAIEIPKIIKVPAPAPPTMMMPPPSPPTKQTIIPITIPLLTHVPAPTPMVSPPSSPPSPTSDGWSTQSNPWGN